MSIGLHKTAYKPHDLQLSFDTQWGKMLNTFQAAIILQPWHGLVGL